MATSSYALLTSPKKIAETVGLDVSTIRKSYIYKPEKEAHLMCLDVGTFLVENNISREELLLAVKTIKDTKKMILERIAGG